MIDLAYLDAMTRWHSEGRRAFAALAAARSQRELARILRVSTKSICAYAAGIRRPSIDVAGDIERKLGIRASHWSIAPLRSPLPVDATRAIVPEDAADEPSVDANAANDRGLTPRTGT